ncbi:translation initiation factor IF-1 [Candidatus Poribacteria bacterium]|nr:MAG: translation initiation factor IF-1 [Candidatus Poribacteria bacterium]
MRIHQRAIVLQVLKGGTFRCHLRDNENHEVNAYPCGNMRRHRIVLCAGDEVTVELSPYDLERGRVIWRQSVE